MKNPKALSGGVVFARRNVLETMRSPASWAFGLALPIGIFIIMQIIVNSIGERAAANVPMFGVDRFTGGAVIFGAAFLSLFCAMLISSDRAQSFLSRLYASPLTSVDYIVGYMLGVLPIAAAQSVTIFVAALCFGLTPTVNILPALLFAVLFSVMFVSIGMIFGSTLSAKGAPPVCSAVVQVAALLSGMWFDLDMIGGGFAVFCRVFPFAHVYDIIRYALTGDWANVWLPFVIAFAYTVALTAVAVVVFEKRAKKG